MQNTFYVKAVSDGKLLEVDDILFRNSQTLNQKHDWIALMPAGLSFCIIYLRISKIGAMDKVL